MQHHPLHNQCMNCYDSVPALVSAGSVNQLGYTLCTSCQEYLKQKLRNTSRETIKLFFSLKQRGVPAELANMPGGKENMEIAVAHSHVNIEVDAPLSNCNPRKALSELKRSLFFIGSADHTLHIPNALIAYNLDETADCIAEQWRTSNCSGRLHLEP